MTGARLARLPLALCLLALGAGSGCAGLELEGQVRGIRNVIKTARENGAYTCAPKPLALAEFNAQAADDELDQGNYFRAKTHVKDADKYARQAFQESPPERCARKVVIAPRVEPPKTEIKIIDTDGDGIPDDIDKCPTEPEDKDGFQDEDGCPDPDNDGDGIPDAQDKCPNEPEDKDGFEDADGCPDEDNDKDGIADKDDKCPNEPGPKENDGCPDKDRDGDGVVDRLDDCPDEPGPADNKGCPKKFTLIEVKEDKIEIKEKIFFATAKSKILPRSFPLLDQVVEALKAHAKLRLRIEGHTDIRGGYKMNMRLSDARAASVRTYLVEHGIDASRLESKGYGPDQPIGSNRTAAGREQNRRVEFMIIK
ncbi:MAG TPA: OmpA family protein [Polyangia bacterium]|jgi:outer membrane protein OmpA-like peptidoglycan-associated protein